jgi:hypothetical protein
MFRLLTIKNGDVLSVGSNSFIVHIGCDCRTHIITISTAPKVRAPVPHSILASGERHDKTRAKELKYLKRNLEANPHSVGGRDRAQDRRDITTAHQQARVSIAQQKRELETERKVDDTGLSMMKKMGYVPGAGLGKDESGRVEPVKADGRVGKGKSGLGAKEKQGYRKK